MFSWVKPIILVLVILSPVIYYFEVKKQGRWDVTHLQDMVSGLLVGMY
ncbi:MAG: hypothetical protein P8H57_03200 [Emcibacteraceae bacterium]|nr:hypothetical protein [Emcibacteraceae bacterium]MDG1859710.1 hypothetical protein [Emcibacteraceae bacterium]